ncbi:MAG: glycosyltransferase family 4 protein [Anaerolineales bacterium]
MFKEAFDKVLSSEAKFAKIHTASSIMQQRLLAWGVSAQRLVRIPLGVDLKAFIPATEQQKSERRRELGIPEKAFCIGSFHKDGVGMDAGDEPKPIKGPDILLKVVEGVSRQHPVFVLLSAPARGYVKAGLERLGVPYAHVVLDDYLQMPRLYRAIDLYLLTSREEGGPKGVLESLASGIPIVATRVGLAPDVIRPGENGLLADSEDVPSLVGHVMDLIESPGLRTRFAVNGLKTITDYDWSSIAARYYAEIYKPILEQSAK